MFDVQMEKRTFPYKRPIHHTLYEKLYLHSFIRMLRFTRGSSVNIHIGDYLIPKEVKRFGNWIQLDVDESISDSPRLQPDGNSFVVWEEDLASPFFIRMLIERFIAFIC